MESQQLPLTSEHCMEKTRGGEKLQRLNTLRDFPAGHLWAVLIVSTTFCSPFKTA